MPEQYPHLDIRRVLGEPRTASFAIVLIFLLALTGSASVQAQEDAEVVELVRGAVEFYNERNADPLFAMTQEQLGELMGGEVVKIRRKVPVLEVEGGEERHHERITAYYLVRQPMLRVWVAALTPEFNSGGMLTEVRLRADAHGNSRWYQHAALPWPVADRHWTIDLQKNPELSAASGGRVWQHAWKLTENGEEVARETVASGKAGSLTLDSVADAVYLPLNRGAWVMFGLRDKLTLIAYELSTSLGGHIPENLVNTLAMTRLEQMLHETGQVSAQVDRFYVRGHSPIYSGDGYRIPWFGEDPPAVELKSRSVLPANSFRESAASGNFIAAANGVDPPFETQPVQGFSDLEPHPSDGFWVLSDNGYGAKTTSADYVLAIYHIRPDFQNGTMELLRSIELSDPKRLAGFSLVAEVELYPDSEIAVDPRIRDARLLTGFDFDPEGLAAMPDGSFWVGEEFGPFLLHFDAKGALMSPPVSTPGVWAAENPLHAGEANHPSSGGFEGLCKSWDQQTIYGLLEKTAQGDPEGQLRLYRFDPRAGEFMEDAPFRRYQLSEEQGHYIGAICALNEQELAIVERDDFQGEKAAFKKVFVVKLDDHENGVLRKRELVDLLLIPDPVLLAREVEGNRVTGSFAMPFVTIEGIACLDEHTLLVCNDNNYPFSVGRNLRQQLPDDNEIVLIHLR